MSSPKLSQSTHQDLLRAKVDWSRDQWMIEWSSAVNRIEFAEAFGWDATEPADGKAAVVKGSRADAYLNRIRS